MVCALGTSFWETVVIIIYILFNCYDTGCRRYRVGSVLALYDRTIEFVESCSYNYYASLVVSL